MYHATLTIWMRHMRKFFRNREELGGLLIQPILWVGLFGIGMGRMVDMTGNYLSFMLPGILALTVLGGAAGGGMMFLDERLRGILREYQIAPIPRLGILLGHMLATLTKAFFQVGIVVVVGWVAGARWQGSFLGSVVALVALVCFGVGFAGIALAVAARSRSIMGYHGMIFLFNLPLLFASNALYPLTEVPTWMQWLALINPATWYIEVSRSMGGDVQSTLTPFLGMGLLVGFAAAGTWLALRRFQQLTQRT
jgi:ABC-2 type transport system permease protein